MSEKILLIGGGGHCKSVLDTLLETNQFSDIGIIDAKNKIGEKVFSVPIIGSDDQLSELYQKGYHYAFVTVGSVGNTQRRVSIFRNLKKIGCTIPNIIDPTATVSARTKMGEGIYVGKKSVINAGAIIHDGVIINTSSIVEHDCIIKEFAHISPGAVLCGGVQVGAHTHIGANSVVKQNVIIGSRVMIGMGSVVLKNFKDDVVAYGNPCREATP